MIIYGSRTISKTQGTGVFLCPLCKMQRPYRHQVNKRYFTLYFIPLFPMYNQGDHVECNACGEGFATEVLSLAAELQAEIREAGMAPSGGGGPDMNDLRRAMLLVLVEAGRTDPTHLARLRDWCHSVGLSDTTDDVVMQELSHAQRAGARFAQFGPMKLGYFTPEQRVAFVAAARQILCGPMQPMGGDNLALRSMAFQLGVPGQSLEQALV
jgi:hypothetical protein